MVKIYLTAGQAACIYRNLGGKQVRRMATASEIVFGFKYERFYKSANTFGDFIDANDIDLIEA